MKITYFKLVEPDTKRALLCDGQYYLPRFGNDTLQVMQSDGVFEQEALPPDEDECSECESKDEEIADLEEEIETLKEEIAELKKGKKS